MNEMRTFIAGDYEMVAEARDDLGNGPNSDEANILIKVQSINSYRPLFIMPALSNASVELQEVIYMDFVLTFSDFTFEYIFAF